MSTKKTEVMTQVPCSGTTARPSFSIGGDLLNNDQQSTYLGSILSSDCDVTTEIQHHIKMISAAFGRPTRHVFFNHNLTVSSKVAVYNAMCVSILLSGSEAWTLYTVCTDGMPKPLKPFTSSACKESSASDGGTKSPTSRSGREPMYIKLCNGNCAG